MAISYAHLGGVGYQVPASVTFAASATASSVLNTRGYTSGAIYLPAEFNTDAITFQGSNLEDGTFATILNASAGAVGFTAASGARWYHLPSECFGVGFLKVVTGTATADAATVLVSLRCGGTGTPPTSISVTADTEFPAAAALADNAANPTTTGAAAYKMEFNGTTWDRELAPTRGAGSVAAGTHRVTHASDDPVTAAVQIMDDWDESDRAKVNPIAGQAGVQGGSGSVSALTQRVVLATDVGLPAGTSYLGQAAAPMQFVTVSMTTPTDAQDTGDVIADTQVVTNATRANDVPAKLESITIIDTDDQKAVVTAVFFSANTSLGTEDSAPDIDDTEVLTVLGSVEFVAADYIDLGGASYATKKNVGLMVTPATGTRNIYMALYVPATSSPTYASGIITVHLGFSS